MIDNRLDVTRSAARAHQVAVVPVLQEVLMKPKKLKLARETLVTLATRELLAIRGGATPAVSAFPVACEPSGIVACPV